MTYEELKNHIAVMDKDQLKQNVTLFDSADEEFCPIDDIGYADNNCDVLDTNHPFLIIYN
jgi:hypothetical protein